MEVILEHLSTAGLIAGICVLMVYPYLGAGVMLAALCYSAERYGLMIICITVCVALHITMGKKIKPVRGAVAPSAASRRNKRKAAKMQRRQFGQPRQHPEQNAENNAAGSQGAEPDASEEELNVAQSPEEQLTRIVEDGSGDI